MTENEDVSDKSRLLSLQKIFTSDAARKAINDKTIKVTDSYENFLSKIGIGIGTTQRQNTLSSGTYQFDLITRNRILLEAAYRGSWVVGKIVDSVAEDMTRGGITITTNEDDESDLKDLMKEMSRLKISKSLCWLEKWARLYGGAIAVVQIEGQKMDTPLNLDSIKEGQFKGLVVYDRWQLNPILIDVIQSGPEMGLPKFYQIVNQPSQLEPNAPTNTGEIKVHHSRVIRNIGIQLPYFQAITEMMWGESDIERLWDRLIAFDNVTMSAASLVDRANLRRVGIQGLREILAAGGESKEGLVAQFEMMRLLQTNEGITLLDKEDEYSADSYTFAGLADMIIQFGQQLAGASEIPLVRMFGQSPAGLNATGESDIRMYYDSILAKQEDKFRSGWQLILEIMWRSVFGKPAPDDMEFQFVPLWQMSATDKANIGKTRAETIIGAYEATLISKKSALEELRETSDDTGLFSNISDEDINEAEADEDAPPDPLEGSVELNATLPTKPEEPGKVDPNKAGQAKDAVVNSFTAKIKKWISK